MAKRENGYGPVKSWFETPAQRAERERRLQERSAPPIKKWQRTMTKEQFMQAVAEGRTQADIILKHFNNDPNELRKQLKEWSMTEKEAAELAKVAKPIDITKEQYLQRRLNGETRTQIINSLGIAKPRAYELLKEWGIRELDAEERELDRLASPTPADTVNERAAEVTEQKTEARKDHQLSTEPGEDILKRMEQRAAAQEQELANLQAAVELWKNDAERKGEHIADLEAEITRFNQQSTEQAAEIARLSEALCGAAAIADQAGAEIRSLKEERQMLLQTIEHAAGTDASMITLQIPIMPVQVAVLERTRIYSTLEALSQSVEGAEIDRKRVAIELFELLQRVVNFVTADLVELLPGQDSTVYIHEFFDYYNRQHIQSLTEMQQVG